MDASEFSSVERRADPEDSFLKSRNRCFERPPARVRSLHDLSSSWRFSWRNRVLSFEILFRIFARRERRSGSVEARIRSAFESNESGMQLRMFSQVRVEIVRLVRSALAHSSRAADSLRRVLSNCDVLMRGLGGISSFRGSDLPAADWMREMSSEMLFVDVSPVSREKWSHCSDVARSGAHLRVRTGDGRGSWDRGRVVARRRPWSDDVGMLWMMSALDQ